MTDQITLTMPRERPYFGVARLVLGGLAARLDVTVESLEDLELALDGLLERGDPASEITVELEVDDDELHARVGPFGDQSVRKELEGDPGETLSLRRLLDAVVDSYEVTDGDGGTWVELQKRFGRA
jgi:anti-sigma regulatory factor (Ser/Thr protein kinase)